MKIKYTDTTETTLLDILKWENDFERDVFTYENDSIEIEIYFWENHKEVILRIAELSLTLRLETYKVSPEKVNKIIESLIKASGVK